MDEFEIINNYFKKLTGKNSLALQDDVALLENQYKLAFSTDIIVENIHFFKNSSPRIIAYKLLETALSDLAAKALTPKFYSLNLSLPRDISSSWFSIFSATLLEIQEKYNIYLLGGDLTECDNKVLSVTVFGEYEYKFIPRNNAHNGDLLWVSGTIGDSYLGLEFLRGNLVTDINKDYFITKYNYPRARLDLKDILLSFAHAAIDVSDGLIQDISHLAKASGKKIVIDYSKIPFSVEAKSLLTSIPDLIYKLPFAGDDYQIAFTVAANRKNSLLQQAAKYNVMITEIGTILPGSDVDIINVDKNKLPSNSGYKHF
jgi:thiamine-monophosphate kinase